MFSLMVAFLFAGAQPSATGPQPAAVMTRWQALPPTPRIPLPWRKRTVNGVRIAYAAFGHGPVIVFLHGGYANGDYWAVQARALSRRHRVVVMDTRGQGRSGGDGRPLSYRLFADDVIALADALKIASFSVAGWSDGGIVALELAMHRGARIERVFTLGANATPDGVEDSAGSTGTFKAYRLRAAHEYAALSPLPGSVATLRMRMHDLAGTPDWTRLDLSSIRARVLIGIGDHDEAIRRAHAEMLAATIPGAELLVLPATGHFAMLQAPALTTAALTDFFDRQ